MDRDNLMIRMPNAMTVKVPQRHAQLCANLIASRKALGRRFGFDLISDPAGDMLLDLYAREGEGRATSVSSLPGAANVAYGTARRVILALEQRKILRRSPDPVDGRRFLISLTNYATEVLERAFDLIIDEPFSHYIDAGTTSQTKTRP